MRHRILHAEQQGAAGSAIALRGDARQLGRKLLNDYRDRCSLILTSPPYGPSTHGHVRKHDDHVEELNDRYSHNPDNLAHLPARRGPRIKRPAFDSVVAEILAGCARMLEPGRGRLVLTVRPYREHGALVDLPGRLIRLAEQCGLDFCSREVALLCGLKGNGLALRASFFQLYHQRAGTIERMLLIGHEDVRVFKRKPFRRGPASRVPQSAVTELELGLTVPASLLDALAERVARRVLSQLAPPQSASPWLDVEGALAFLPFSRDQLYKLTAAKAIPFRKSATGLRAA